MIPLALRLDGYRIKNVQLEYFCALEHLEHLEHYFSSLPEHEAPHANHSERFKLKQNPLTLT